MSRTGPNSTFITPIDPPPDLHQKLRGIPKNPPMKNPGNDSIIQSRSNIMFFKDRMHICCINSCMQKDMNIVHICNKKHHLHGLILLIENRLVSENMSIVNSTGLQFSCWTKAYNLKKFGPLLSELTQNSYRSSSFAHQDARRLRTRTNACHN